MRAARLRFGDFKYGAFTRSLYKFYSSARIVLELHNSLLIEREIRLCYNLICEFCTLLLRKTIGRLIIRLSNCEFFNAPPVILHYALNFNVMLFRCKFKSIMFSFDLSCDKLSIDETINYELLIIRIFEAILNTLLLY